MANALARPLVAVGFALMIGLASVTAMAGPVEDLDNQKRQYDSLKSSFESTLDGVNKFFDSSRRLRELDKAEMEELTDKICASDLEPDEAWLDVVGCPLRHTETRHGTKGEGHR